MIETSDDLFFATAAELGALLRRRKISSLELTKIFLDRLERIGPRYNALAELTRDLVLRQARRADRRLRSGEATPLTGVPYGAKDLLATKGIPTRWGAPPYRDQVFDYDATVVTRMREAGAVLIGKLAMVELAGGGGYAFPSASLNGPGLNPWNTDHWTGGSSSGAGSAVAAGLVPLALGSETWGSIVSPSAHCGITGLRPTWGLVSRYGAMELSGSMDKIGPMARSAEDCGLALAVLAGSDPRDETTSRDFVFKRRAGSRMFRLGVLPLDYTDHPETERAFEEALRVLRKRGMRVTRATTPLEDVDASVRTVLEAEAGAAHRDLVVSGRVDELVDEAQAAGLKQTLEISAADYIDAQRVRAEAATNVLALFEKFDALVAPTMLGEAPDIAADLRTLRGKRTGYAVLGALAGVPCLTVPMGFGPRGLPLGLSVTGDLFDENTILQIGMAYQRETAWHTMRPAVLADDDSSAG